MLRWIDELNGITDADSRAREIKRQIKGLKKQDDTKSNRKAIKTLYAELDSLQYKPDYMCLIIDKKSDYYRACKGFKINGIEYTRLLGTNGGIKNSTIVFVSSRLHGELERRIENDRDKTKPLVTAKLESYRALTCSASVPVSTPRGILVVDDVETTFRADTLYITDENDGEPEIIPKYNEEVILDASDGYGLMLPSLAERWSRELDLDYIVAGVNTRFSFEKGMLVTFDFLEFAEKVAGSYIVTDAWGDKVDIRNVEAVFTTSMIKLWDSYKSCDDYLSKSLSNGYTFGIAKNSPKELENERALNYQFIQSYHLDDNDIEDLIAPTMTEIKEVLSGDWAMAVLFMSGVGLDEYNVMSGTNKMAKAIMIDHRVFDDPFVKNSIYQSIRNRIDEAKVGVLKVHGNYSIISGDPYLLCQHIFNLKLTGILKKGEIYNKYWKDCGADRLACFRAPMTSMNNVRIVRPNVSDEAEHWFKYMNTITVFNGWDLCSAALNGCDYDGDIVFLTDNDVLIRKHRDLPVLMCAQKRAEKRISSQEDFIKSNIDSFGNDIGRTTNWITSMFEVQSRFPEGSEEYKTLEYRIMTGQLFQQDAIDRAKGIICKPMPKYWHDWHAVKDIANKKQKALCKKIVANKKPYFMKYIYPNVSKSYRTFIVNSEKNAGIRFNKTIKDLVSTPPDKRTDDENIFIRNYQNRLPLGIGDCVINKICRRFEEEFDGGATKYTSGNNFDYRILKSPAKYSQWQYDKISGLYRAYNQKLRSYSMFMEYERVDDDEAHSLFYMLDWTFREDCMKVCSNEEILCNIMLDICYSHNATKAFVWNICGEQIVNNLLAKHDNIIMYPHKDESGDIYFRGYTFSIESIEVDMNDYNS